MSDYTIYKICCDDCNEIYVGSTKAFRARKNHHKSNCNNINSKKYNLKIYQTIRDNGGWTNWRMCPLEELQNVSKREAEIQEENWRVILTANLNSQKASIGDMTMTEYQKQYYDQNSERLKEKSKEYYEQNSERLKEKNREYYEQNSERFKEKNKEYYEQNSEKFNRKIVCECGAVINQSSKSRHKKTLKHKRLMEAKL